MRDTQREAETQAEDEAGSMQEARCGTQSGTTGSCPEPKADAQPLSNPVIFNFNFNFASFLKIVIFCRYKYPSLTEAINQYMWEV